MTKKKTPTPVKKAAPKKKSGKTITYVRDADAKMEWKQTNEAYIPGLGTIKKFYVTMEGPIDPPAGETRISELEAENYALKTLLSKHQSEPMQQIKGIPPQRATMLSQFAEELDGQLSRLYNSLNTLDTLAGRLLISKEDVIKANSPEAQDLSTRYGNLLAYFCHQNDRLDFLNTKLSDLI